MPNGSVSTMPHDLHWPRYDDDGTFVQMGDWVISNSGQKCGEAFKVNKVWFENGTAHMSDRVTDGHYWHYKKKDPYVRRALLDHEGKPLYQGNLAWNIYTGERAEVLSYIGKCVYVLWENDVHDKVVPCCLTSIKPAFDCDGKLIKVGQTVWHVSNGTEFTVVGLPKSGEYQAVKLRLDDGTFTGLDPDQLTHQRPVFDADGVPIKVGDVVWSLTDGRKHEVTGIDPIVKEIRIKDESMELGVWVAACGFTHAKPEPPDSWERIAEDIDRLRENVALYLGDYLYDDNVNGSIQSSLVCVANRCRALAERGE